MKKIRQFILVFLFLFPSTNLFAGYVTFNQEVDFDNYASGGTAGLTAGIEFNHIDFHLLNNSAMRPETIDEIALNLRKVF